MKDVPTNELHFVYIKTFDTFPFKIFFSLSFIYSANKNRNIYRASTCVQNFDFRCDPIESDPMLIEEVCNNIKDVYLCAGQ